MELSLLTSLYLGRTGIKDWKYIEQIYKTQDSPQDPLSLLKVYFLKFPPKTVLLLSDKVHWYMSL